MIEHQAEQPRVCSDCGRKFGSEPALQQHIRSTHKNPAWAKSRATPSLQCPKCGGPPEYSLGKFGTKAACCGLWSWNGKPLVNGETHRARIMAHDAFDRLWKSGPISRGECYRRLQVLMGMSSADCHIARMSAIQARQVVQLVRAGALAVDPSPAASCMEVTA